LGQLSEDWKDLGDFVIWGNVRRRGADVNVPEIGSRGACLCIGGISGFCAELRREMEWGNLNLMVFGILGGNPREACEEGGHYVFS
jgi:hypothetical protein